MTEQATGNVPGIILFVKASVKSRWPYLAIIAAAFYVYFRALFFGYTFLDDNVLILDNNWFLQDPANIGQAFLREVFNTHAAAAYYRPLLTLSFMLDAQVGGTAPFIYHLTNMFFHMLASCMVFAFLTTLGVRRHPAFALALIFAVHPVLSQAVAWIPGRNDSLLAVFVLSAMIMLVRYWESGKSWYLLAHCFLFACGLFTKESMAFFPFCALLWLFLTWWMIPRSAEISGGEALTGGFRKGLLLKWRQVVGLGIAWLLPGILWLTLRSIALAGGVHYSTVEIIKSLWKNVPAIFIYTGKFVFPFNLSSLPTLQDSTLIFGVIASSGIVAAVLISVFRYRTVDSRKALFAGQLTPVQCLFFGLFWFLIFLVLSFIQPYSAYPANFSEHRFYLPMVGLLLAVAQIKGVENLDLRKAPVLLTVGACVYALSLITAQHLTVFGDRISFWENAAKNSPHHPLARKNLGSMYYLDGKIDLAEKEYRAALELFPQETMVHNNLGLIYKLRGENLKAQEEFKKELVINPNYDNAYFNWGLLCYTTGNKKDAETLWRKTLEVNPDYLDAMRNLSSYYREIGDTVNEHRFSSELARRGIKR